MSAVGERVLRARLQLMLDHAFLASAVARLPLVEVPPESWCRTAATDGFRILWNPVFFGGLNDAEIAGVLAHEVMHAVLGHIDRRGLREPYLWNQAIDHATNLLLIEHEVTLPKPRLSEYRFRGMTAEQIYAQLSAGSPPKPFSRRQTVVATSGPVRIGRRRAAAKSSQQGRGFQAASIDAECDDNAGESFDLHIEPGDPRLDGLTHTPRPSPMELVRLRHELQQNMIEEISRSRRQGSIPGDLVEAVRRAGQARAPWQALLARCFSGVRSDDYRFLPPSRRHIWRGLYLPSVGAPGPRLVVCAIDTSGSINIKMARRFLTEVHALRTSAQCRIHVIQCDAQIRSISTFESWEAPPSAPEEEKFIGRGGTDFRPVFDWIDEEVVPRDGTPDLLAYLTDGLGTVPSTAPSYPTVWLMPERSSAKLPFGLKIEIPAT